VHERFSCWQEKANQLCWVNIQTSMYGDTYNYAVLKFSQVIYKVSSSTLKEAVSIVSETLVESNSLVFPNHVLSLKKLPYNPPHISSEVQSIDYYHRNILQGQPQVPVKTNNLTHSFSTQDT